MAALLLALAANVWLALAVRKALKPVHDAANQWSNPHVEPEMLKHWCHFSDTPADQDGNLLVYECLGCHSRQFRVRWPGKPLERVGN